jgi:drug/metabolite transporter (DMT)-like permease
VELTKLVVAGLIMGIGTIAFNFVVNSRQLDASISIPIIDTAMLLVSVVGAVLFFAEPMTARKVIGVVLLIAGIAVLKPE